MPFDVVKSLYYTLVFPYLNYCVTIWGNDAKCHLSILTKCQNYFLRVLFNLKKYDHISSFYKSSNIFNIKEIFIQRLLTLFYKLFIYKFSSFFYSFLESNISYPIYAVRNSNYFITPKFRTKIYRNSPLCQGMKLWNSLPKIVTGSIQKPYIWANW